MRRPSRSTSAPAENDAKAAAPKKALTARPSCGSSKCSSSRISTDCDESRNTGSAPSVVIAAAASMVRTDVV
jgi:hypothetical protein